MSEQIELQNESVGLGQRESVYFRVWRLRTSRLMFEMVEAQTFRNWEAVDLIVATPKHLCFITRYSCQDFTPDDRAECVAFCDAFEAGKIGSLVIPGYSSQESWFTLHFVTIPPGARAYE